MISLGLDLSLTGTGLIKIDKECKVVENILIRSKPPKEKNALTELKRIIKIRDEIKENAEGVDIVVIEGLAFMARNSTALVQLAGLNYMVREVFYNLDIPFVMVAPTSLKKYIAGKGNCPKDLMLLETYKKFNISFADDNLCDAFGLAIIGQSLINSKTKLNKPQQEVIELLKK